MKTTTSLATNTTAMMLLVCLGVACEAGPAKQTAQQPPTPAASDTAADLPTLSEFLADHPEYGSKERMEQISDWTHGERHVVEFSSGRRMTFYLQNGGVKAVYEIQSGIRKKIWGEYSTETMEEPDRDVSESADIPAYTIKAVNLLGGGKLGDIIIPSMSRKTPPKERERVIRLIQEKEALTVATLYSSEAAFKADYSESYQRQHPDALRTGFLGSLRDGVFTPGEKVFP